MDKALRPGKLCLDPGRSADGQNRAGFVHWKTTLDQYIEALKTGTTELTDGMKLQVLISHITPEIFTMIESIDTFKDAMTHLQSVFVKSKNTIHTRYLLTSRKQHEGESVKQYYLALRTLAKDCNFTQVSADVHLEESVRTTFISGLNADEIRRRLLEETKGLEATLKIADVMEEAANNSKMYNGKYNPSLINAIVPETGVLAATAVSRSKWKCFKCGGSEWHRRNDCPANNTACEFCHRKGHWAVVCRQKKGKGHVSAISYSTHLANPSLESVPNTHYNGGSPTESPHLSSVVPHPYSTGPYLASVSTPNFPASLSNSVINVKVNHTLPAFALLDTGSTLSFVSESFAKLNNLTVIPYSSRVTLATESNSSTVRGACDVTLDAENIDFGGVRLLVLGNLCADLIIGHDLFQQHSHIRFDFGGPKPPIQTSGHPVMAAIAHAARIGPKSLFAHLTPDVRPIACPSRKFSGKAAQFIAKTVEELREANVIRPSNSPWRAQVLVTGLDKPKPRMVVDYSRTINRFTLLDAFPLPSIETTVSKIAQFSRYSSYDLRSAYYQLPILDSEKEYTAFEAAGGLWEFNVVPFGATNGVPVFCRALSELIEAEGLRATVAYVDNVTICGDTTEELDHNVQRWLETCRKHGLTLNEDKTISNVEELSILGYRISRGSIKPDPDRLKPLMDMPLPHDKPSLARAMGLFSYYARWVTRFSDRIQPLVNNRSFPISREGKAAFEDVKAQIAKSWVICPNDKDKLVLESDASDTCLSASLSQGGKPVAFFSRTLNSSERKHHPMEKEACAIVEACRKWFHYLVCRKFQIITDQQAVSFMFNQKHNGRVKNDKILRWRLELSSLDFDIQYRPGPYNVTADCLSRANTCASTTTPNRRTLLQIHEDLAHPGVVRLNHFIRTKNLPYSLDQVKTVCSQCRTCAMIKPQFFRPVNPPLIEATKPLDRLSVDFKEIPSTTRNKYLFVAVDEYSRYVWAFPCSNMETATVKRCLVEIFSFVGNAGFVHSDRGSSLISHELRTWLISNGISFSNSTKYNPRGNGQVERFNGVVWKGIQLACHSRGLPESHYEQVLHEVLHSQRSLLCTATNSTPHERLFSFERRSASGASLPTWLLQKGPVLVRQHARKSKYMPVVTEVELIEANPSFAKIRYKSGREDCVSLRDLAPLPRDTGAPDADTPSSPGSAEGVRVETAPRTGETTTDISPISSEALVSESNFSPTSTEALVPEPTELDPHVPEETVNLRRSARGNKGVPPVRYEPG